MKRAVVTGGAGFIGSHLAEELVRRGYHVVILDNLSTGKLENIQDMLDTSDVEFVKNTVTNLDLLRRLFQGIDLIFHHAALVSVPESMENPAAYHEVNLGGTLNVLMAAKENRVKKVVYVSSSAVYGDSPSLPSTEDMLPTPVSLYAATKLAGEYYCSVFHHAYGLPTVCLRYFNVYGPRQTPTSRYAAVIPSFIQKCLQNKPLIIFGDGQQTRDFTFVRDIAAANISLVENDACGLFNIGLGNSVTINSLAELVMNIIGHRCELRHEAPRPGEVRHSVADISKVKAFGYEPKYTLEAGLRETVRWFKNR